MKGRRKRRQLFEVGMRCNMPRQQSQSKHAGRKIYGTLEGCGQTVIRLTGTSSMAQVMSDDAAGGLNSADDPQFTTTFTDVYSQSSLQVRTASFFKDLSLLLL